MPAQKPWKEAWEEAAFGSSGFYLQQHPYEHFATSVSQDGLASSLLPYLLRALDQLERVTVVDVGAGDGDLGVQLHNLLGISMRSRVHFLALDVRPRPSNLPECIEWVQGDARATIASVEPGNMLLIAHEFLDDLPCDVVEVDQACLAHLGVMDEETRHLNFGPVLCFPAHERQIQWLEKWWPAKRPLMRAEIGSSRDEFWNLATSRITAGFAIAIDYGHVSQDRQRGLWDGGTLAGYRHAMTVTPVADNSVNLTAHVAMDAIAESSFGNPQTLTFQLGPTPDFLWLTVAYGIEFPQPDKMHT
ncbi:MAG: hypothetical protein F2923_00925 [Actinobacteria bacterium]|uniref:Unannotated protein n=1 Tax=freshwater metagenome TaxID=449393 RepID=A0A6J7S0J4_9ZZZZ|nr:hypothetical protein [Actinomycetota bacterium]MTB27184.1 hypothetical protein [Actinomycetota bacterium]